MALLHVSSFFIGKQYQKTHIEEGNTLSSYIFKVVRLKKLRVAAIDFFSFFENKYTLDFAKKSLRHVTF